MEYKVREYPLFAACGINCGLCPRYYTVGTSRCPGCAGEGFSEVHPTCGVLSCCQQVFERSPTRPKGAVSAKRKLLSKGYEYCYECDEFPCKRIDNLGETDSFVSHKNKIRDMLKAKQNGIEAYKAELNEKVKILEKLLNNYNDGRRKSFFCLAVNLLDFDDVKMVMTRLTDETEPDMLIKERAEIATRLFDEMAMQRAISLKLRK